MAVNDPYEATQKSPADLIESSAMLRPLRQTLNRRNVPNASVATASKRSWAKAVSVSSIWRHQTATYTSKWLPQSSWIAFSNQILKNTG